jgi:hypothetical protein
MRSSRRGSCAPALRLSAWRITAEVIGGVIFSPLWVAAIAALGFVTAAATIATVLAVAMWVLVDLLFARPPQQLGLAPDGDAAGMPVRAPISLVALSTLSWRERRVRLVVGVCYLVGRLGCVFPVMVIGHSSRR